MELAVQSNEIRELTDAELDAVEGGFVGAVLEALPIVLLGVGIGVAVGVGAWYLGGKLAS